MSRRLTPTSGASLARLFRARLAWLDDRLLEELARAGYAEIRIAHTQLLAYLDRDGTRISELARRGGTTRQAMHQLVGQLVDEGLLESSPDPTNRSARLVRPTARGEAAMDVAEAAFSRIEAELSAAIGPEHVEALRSALSVDWPSPAPPSQRPEGRPVTRERG